MKTSSGKLLLLILLCLCGPLEISSVSAQEKSDSAGITDTPANSEFHEFATPEPDASLMWEEEKQLPDNLQITWHTLFKQRELRNHHLLNPENALLKIDKQESQTAFDLDWTPEITENLQFRSRALLYIGQFDDEVKRDATLLEAHLLWENSAKTLVVDVGRIRVAWGSGYAWNPTQVLIMPSDHDNSLINDHEGIPMIRTSWTHDSLILTMIIAELEENNLHTGTIEESHPLQGAIKASIYQDPWELELLHYQATEQGFTHGLSFSGLLSDSFELHGEFTVSEKRDRYGITRAAEGIDMGTTYLPARYEYAENIQNMSYYKFLLGGQVTFAGDMNIIIEAYQTTHGYSDEEWEDAGKGIEEARTDNAWGKNTYPYATARGNPYAGFLMHTAAAIENEELRQNYLFFRYTSGESENKWEWEQVLILNVDDKSQLHQFVLHKAWGGTIQSSAELTLFRGTSYSEYGLNPYKGILAITMEYHF